MKNLHNLPKSPLISLKQGTGYRGQGTGDRGQVTGDRGQGIVPPLLITENLQMHEF